MSVKECITFSVVGDILIRKAQPEAARINGKFDFGYVFSDLSAHIRSSDLAIGNLETVFAGNSIPFARSRPNTRSMPLYNCPDELADALQQAGFRVLTTANNHCLDQGPDGLCRTLDVLDKYGFLHTGTARTQDEAQRDLIVEVNGFRVGILAYTYGTNDMPLPENAPWMVNLIGESMLVRTKAMKKKADLVFVCLHAGVEFSDWPSSAQRYWVNRLFYFGADAVLGAHPHVLQPMETLHVTDQDGIRKNRFVIYSLGNLTATPMRDFKTLTGAILQLRAVRRADGQAEIMDATAIPTMVDVHNRYRVAVIDDAISEAAGVELQQLEQAKLHASAVLSARGQSPKPLWGPDELATVACGKWIKRPRLTSWAPKAVRISEPQNWAFNPTWCKESIAFVRNQEELDQIPASRSLGCLVVPKEVCSEVGAAARSTLAVDDVDAAVKAMAAHACLRHEGRRVLIVGKGAGFLSGLLSSLTEGSSVATNQRGRRRWAVVRQFLASLDTSCGFAVFEVLLKRQEAREILRVMRPNVVAFSTIADCKNFFRPPPFTLADSLRPGTRIILPAGLGDASLIEHAFPHCDVIVSSGCETSAILKALRS